MKYYRVKEEFDQFRTGKDITLVANELFTQKEIVSKGIPSRAVEEVNISQRNIHWAFGARFENK